MDIINESVALGVDLIILGLCVREYMYNRRVAGLLKTAPHYSIDGDLKAIVERQQAEGLPVYAEIRGTVTPRGVPLRSALVPGVSGVLQILKLQEHREARGFAGFWMEHRRLLYRSANEMPFELRSQQHGVEIVDALGAAVLDVDVVYDHYKLSKLSVPAQILGLFSGIRQKGLQTTEEVLREGSSLTAIGRLELIGDSLRMQPSPEAGLFLTTATKSGLIKRFEAAKWTMILKIALCGAVSALLIGLMAKKLYRKKRQQKEEAGIHSRLERERRERRARGRPPALSDDELCVVCATNPKEIILLPCGHVCLCEDCSPHIATQCPVCRGKIVSKAAAFIA
ncbi:mitochondrial E3 ubiquitin protein ligase 1-like [Drosophila miranda]|uniref:mitochondrial E3 ubiquitin protein ligase 1-like n=1 Tax=Drosophila miranda TaxID=7229 RepID=UPI0007E62F82|nr:mitochondrial E3 ubiquitin protein ligase 1-like [Drosophila miranda]